MLQSMKNERFQIVEETGFLTPVGELTMCTTAHDEVDVSFTVKDHKIKRTSRKTGFTVLGTLQTF